MTREEYKNRWLGIIANKEKRIALLREKGLETTDVVALRHLVEEQNAERAGVIIMQAMLHDFENID